LSSVVLRLINPQKGLVNFFLGPKQRISEPPRRAAKIISHIMKGGERIMERSTIVEFNINDFGQMIGFNASNSANNQSSILKMTLDDVKKNIDECITKLMNV